MDTGHTAFFEITTGVQQGCILSLNLFFVALNLVMKKATAYTRTGIPWTDQDLLTDLDFADDMAVFTEDEIQLHNRET